MGVLEFGLASGVSFPAALLRDFFAREERGEEDRLAYFGLRALRRSPFLKPVSTGCWITTELC